MLALCSRLVILRRGEPALEVGRFEPVQADGDVLAYARRGRGTEAAFLVVLNLGHEPQKLARPAGAAGGTVVLSTHLDREGEGIDGEIALRPDEGLVIRLAA